MTATLPADMQHILVCTGCDPEARAHLQRETDRRLAPAAKAMLSISETPCMGACGQPVTVAFQAAGKATYVFGGVDLERDMDGIIAFSALYDQSADGWIEDATPCGSLRYRLLARVPARR